MIPTILDCDPGLDDVVIFLAARTLNIVGITVTHKRTPLSATVRNTRQILEFAGLSHIPCRWHGPPAAARSAQYALGSMAKLAWAALHCQHRMSGLMNHI